MSVYHDACICHSSYYERLRQKCHGLSMKGGYVDACFSRGICYSDWRQGPAAPCSTTTRGPWSGLLTTQRWRGRCFEKNKIFSSCELEMCAAQTLTAPWRVAQIAWQSHRQSQWHPSSLSVSPGRMICLSIHADTSKCHDIHADTGIDTCRYKFTK